MKPIRLSISGLHSFREKQEIDFSSLTEMGLFGIFGPTGSGKSTILDAITLALYGDVGRAGHNTQAILNHAEKRLEVVFDFEIGSPGRRKRYRVERVYKRGDGFSVVHQASRLLELEAIDGVEDYGLIVIADAKTSVNQAIQTILGLQQSDFTRAVVLPQGKFAEFLQLTGSDRNLMSERLFGLERYGRALHDRVRMRARLVATKLETIVAAQAELGDASDEAVEAAKTAMEEAERFLASAERDRKEVFERYQEAEQVYGLTGRLNEALEERDVLAQKADQMNVMRRALARSVEASATLPLVVAWREANQEVTSARTAVQSTSEVLEQAQAMLAIAVEQHEDAERNRESREPELVRQRGRLQDALEIEHQLLRHQEELKGIEAAYETVRFNRDKAVSEVTVAHKEAEQLKEERSKTETLLTQHTTSPEVRAHLGTLRTAFNLWTTRSESQSNAYKRYATREEQRQAAQDALRISTAVVHELRETEQQLVRDMEDVSSHVPTYSAEQIQDIRIWKTKADSRVDNLLAAERELDEAEKRRSTAYAHWQNKINEIHALREQAERCERVFHELEQEQRSRTTENEPALIAKLAKRLTTGSPCPVCGSDHHPAPAVLEVDSQYLGENNWSAEDEAAFSQAEQAWKEAEAAFQQADRACTQLEMSVQMLDEEVRRKEQDRERHHQDLLESWPVGGLKIVEVQDIPQDGKAWLRLLAQLDEALVQAVDALENWARQKKVLDEQMGELKDRIQMAEQELALSRAKFATAEQEASQQKAALEEAVVLLELAAKELGQVMDALGLERDMDDDVAEVVQARLDRWDEDDRFASQAQSSLIELNARLTEAQQRLSLAEAERQGTEFVVQEHVLKMQQLRQTVSEQQGKIHEITDGSTVAEALTAVQNELNQLNEAYQSSKSTKESADQQVEEAQKSNTRAQAELQSRTHAAETASRHLSDALARTEFATAQAVEDALLDEGDKVEFETAVSAYDETVNQCTYRIANLDGQLAGRSLDEAEFASAREARDRAEEVYKEAMTLKGSKQQSLSNLLDRKQRWQTLETERIENDSLSKRLGALQSSLQGNRFVQFLAREHMERVVRQASERLSSLTHGRYALTLDKDGNFLMRDDHNGGALRPVSTLSGGETFLTSLSLALALSAHIQLRGQYPLEFFFLDEGFGTLDPDLLDVVISSLEKLHMERLSIGLITHVPELRQRMHRRLIVEPALPAGRGTKVSLEMA